MQSKHPAVFASLETGSRRKRISNRAACGPVVEQSRLWVVHRINLWLLTHEKSTREGAFFNEVCLSAREVMLRIVKLLRSEVSEEVSGTLFFTLRKAQYFTSSLAA